MPNIVSLDVLVVGAGFGGVYQLKRLRDEGFSVKLIESGSDYGGVWYWNRYPGARVDSSIPHYEFSDPGLSNDWTWSQGFPGSAELRGYFQYVAKKWDLRKDTIFETLVTGAAWHDIQRKWVVETNTNITYECHFFLPNTGFAAKRYTPAFKGISSFEGTWIHPSYWPKEELDLRGKKIAVIGTGSTGIQLTQALAPIASDFVLFQRTPNLALPMKQANYPDDRQAIPRDQYDALFAGRKTSYGGFDFSFLPRNTFEDSESQRQKTYQDLWDHGDFHFWLATYQDMLFNDKANTEAYNFWRSKIHARLPNHPHLRETFAPEKKPHAFGCKRISLEQSFYELFTQPHVHLIDLNEAPIVEVTPKGIKTSDGEEHVFDIIISATGFDAMTGGLLDMNIRGEDGMTLKEKWGDGVRTYLGMAVDGFPNLFFTYGPQAPTAFCNGPTCAELQSDWILSLLIHLRSLSSSYPSPSPRPKITARPSHASVWAAQVQEIASASLLPTAKSWYMGDNIPGKRREALIYLGGVPTYYQTLEEVREKGWEGFAIE